LNLARKYIQEHVQKKEPVIALLPEFFDGNQHPGQAKERGQQGPFEFLSRTAANYQIMMCGAYYERRDGFIYNTAPLFDQTGKLLKDQNREQAPYDKNFPQEHEIEDGVTPGTRFRVFDADWGRIGIMTCYDGWFPEAARMLALMGADLILFPSQGYSPPLMHARAADNGVWIAASSQSNPAGVWEPGGAGRTTEGKSPLMATGESGEAREPINGYLREASFGDRDSIVLRDAAQTSRVLVVTVDLNKRQSPAGGQGGPFMCAPGGRRPRDTRMKSLYDELPVVARRWSSSMVKTIGSGG
jgi:predicted amidohydrolase